MDRVAAPDEEPLRRQLAAFVAESIQGVGGALVYPDGFLSNAYRYCREAGGVCIADEVQTGFGRMGSHYWGFETQGATRFRCLWPLSRYPG